MFVLLGTPHASAGQGTEPSELTVCDDSCLTTTLEPLAVIGARDDPVLLRAITAIRRTPTGYYVAAPTAVPGVVAVYDAEGEFVRSFGRDGEGPGEFRSPRPVRGLGSETWIVDDGNPRVTVVDRYGQPTRSFRVRWPPMQGWPLGGDLVLVSRIREPPLHVVDSVGTVLHSFGWNPEHAFPPDFAVGPSGNVWTSQPLQYRLGEWSADGRLLRTLTRNPEWFPSSRGVHWRERMTQSWSLDVDSAGRLWTYFRVRDLRSTTRIRNRYTVTVAQLDSLFDIVIEVIDPDRERVVARHRFQEGLVRPMRSGEGFLYITRQSVEGYISAEVYRIDAY